MSPRNVDLDKFRLRRFVERLVETGEMEVRKDPVPLGRTAINRVRVSLQERLN